MSTIWSARASFNSGRSGSFVAPSPPTPPTHWCAPLFTRVSITATVCWPRVRSTWPTIFNRSCAPAARLVLQLPYRSFVTGLMHQQLHWLDIQSRVRYKIGLLVYKCLQGFAPRYLSDFCVPVQVSSTRSSLRSARFQERLSHCPSNENEDNWPSQLLPRFAHCLELAPRWFAWSWTLHLLF